MAGSSETNDRSNVLKFVDTFLKCEHCKKRLSEPLILACSHNLCKACVEILVQSDETISCPTCKDNYFLIPDKGVDGIKANHFLAFLLKYIDLIESFTGTDTELPNGNCALCDTDGVSVYCLECSGAICSNCEGQHEKMRPFKGHTLVKMEEILGEDLADVIRRLGKGEVDDDCSSHKGEPARFYCQQCHTPVCRDCTVLDHNSSNHQVTTLEEMASSRRKILNTVLETLAKKKLRNSEFIASKDETKQKVLDQKAEASKAIEDKATEIINEVESQKKLLLEKLERVTEARLAGNEKVFEAAEIDYKAMSTTWEIANLLMKVGKDAHIIHVSPSYYRAMKKQNEKLDNTTLAPELQRLGVVFEPGIDPEEVVVGQISQDRHHTAAISPGANSWPPVGSLREFSSAFWKSLQD